MPSLSWHWLNGGMLQPVVVLAGGLSHQRDISLKSGRTVAQALRRVGHEVVEADIDSALIETLRANDGAVVFPMLHGGQFDSRYDAYWPRCAYQGCGRPLERARHRHPASVLGHDIGLLRSLIPGDYWTVDTRLRRVVTLGLKNVHLPQSEEDHHTGKDDAEQDDRCLLDAHGVAGALHVHTVSHGCERRHRRVESTPRQGLDRQLS